MEMEVEFLLETFKVDDVATLCKQVINRLSNKLSSEDRGNEIFIVSVTIDLSQYSIGTSNVLYCNLLCRISAFLGEKLVTEKVKAEDGS